eukprot:UN31877
MECWENARFLKQEERIRLIFKMFVKDEQTKDTTFEEKDPVMHWDDFRKYNQRLFDAKPLHDEDFSTEEGEGFFSCLQYVIEVNDKDMTVQWLGEPSDSDDTALFERIAKSWNADLNKRVNFGNSRKLICQSEDKELKKYADENQIKIEKGAAKPWAPPYRTFEEA